MHFLPLRGPVPSGNSLTIEFFLEGAYFHQLYFSPVQSLFLLPSPFFLPSGEFLEPVMLIEVAVTSGGKRGEVMAFTRLSALSSLC